MTGGLFREVAFFLENLIQTTLQTGIPRVKCVYANLRFPAEELDLRFH